ncbi:MAG: high frequency lysogenization protein HflD [Ketobacter sp.]|uniref:high frequency lysogenization protein HflD n=1 Tax=Ketobacter sp. MCCC 1A13808 TaxID=2602738 RepID=UPI0018DC568C|nr:high frequency lysogenization protein HflD [Ketobacter sp. MCCC 1A13808]
MRHSEEEKALALAGLFQAAAMVQQVARTGEVNQEAYNPLISSVFNLDPKSVEDVYQGVSGVKLGVDTLLLVLREKESARYADAIRYTIGMLHIEKLLKRDADINSVLRSRLEQVTNQLQHFDGMTSPAVISKLNDIYLDTLAKFKFRIQVNGDPSHLQKPENAAQIRAILLAGVRSAMLWRQMGGSRLQFAFGKSKLISILQKLQQEITFT